MPPLTQPILAFLVVYYSDPRLSFLGVPSQVFNGSQALLEVSDLLLPIASSIGGASL